MSMRWDHLGCGALGTFLKEGSCLRKAARRLGMTDRHSNLQPHPQSTQCALLFVVPEDKDPCETLLLPTTLSVLHEDSVVNSVKKEWMKPAKFRSSSFWRNLHSIIKP